MWKYALVQNYLSINSSKVTLVGVIAMVAKVTFLRVVVASLAEEGKVLTDPSIYRELRHSAFSCVISCTPTSLETGRG